VVQSKIYWEAYRFRKPAFSPKRDFARASVAGAHEPLEIARAIARARAQKGATSCGALSCFFIDFDVANGGAAIDGKYPRKYIEMYRNLCRGPVLLGLSSEAVNATEGPSLSADHR
jgi:hypothetical protein